MKNGSLSARVWRDPRYFIAFGFGSGLMPIAPGTWGTVAAIPIYLLLTMLSPLPYLIAVALFFGLGVWVSEYVTNQLKMDDYPGIVWDEVVGYLITMFSVPPRWYWIIIGFLLFRLFDILKPFPIRWVDKNVKGGLGIMLDDVLAAIPAWILLQLSIGFLGAA